MPHDDTRIAIAQGVAQGAQGVNLKTAAALTGRTEATIKRWERADELHPTPTGQVQGGGKDRTGRMHKGMVRLFDPEELRAVNDQHGGRWHDERMPAPDPGDLAHLAGEVRRLQLELAALRAQVEGLGDDMGRLRTLQRRQPEWRPSGDAETLAGVLAPPGHAGAPQRLTSERSSPGALSLASFPRRGRVRANDTLPEGWVAVSSWAEKHGLNQRSVERQIAHGQLPLPEIAPEDVPWTHGQYPIKRAYTPEQHQEACAAAARLWPGRFIASCGPECPYRPDAESEAIAVHPAIRAQGDGEASN